MFVFLLLFVLPTCQAADQRALLDQFLSLFVANTLGSEGLTASIGASVTVITPQTNKAELVTTIMANLYGLHADTKQFVKFESDDSASVEAALEVGTLVASVNWALGGQSATTYATVNTGDFVPDDAVNILESVTKTFTRQPTGADSKMNPQALPPRPAKFHAAFLDGFDTPVAAFDAEVKCDSPPPTCSLSATCSDDRQFCKCLVKSRVECAAQDSKCFGEVAYVGYCGAATISFDEKNFGYVVDTQKDYIYYNAYVKLEKACGCRPPK